MGAEEIRLTDLPAGLCEEIGKFVSDYAVGFVKLLDSGANPDAAVGGSGTCVRVGRHHAILTAGHVLEHFGANEDIGLIVATRFEPTLHQYVLKPQTVTSVLVAYEHNGPEGPDLGLLRGMTGSCGSWSP